MTDLRAAAQQGLRALKALRLSLLHPDSLSLADASIAALDAALAQQEQEPVALRKSIHIGCDEPRVCAFHRTCMGRCHKPLTDARTAASLRRTDAAALAQQKQENLTRQMPEWMDYDPATDVLTIHGRRYSAAMFGEQGFLSPVGTLLQVAEGQPDCITLTTVPLGQQEQEPVAWVNAAHLQAIQEKAKALGLTLGLYGYAEIYTNESQGRVPLYTHPPRRETEQEPVAMLWKVRKALALASAICDRVPNRWHHTHEIGSAEGDIGDMVNAHPDGTHGYRLIQEAEAELVAYLTTPQAAPPRRETEQEPVASQNTQEKCRIETVPAKGGLLHPPRREWQSLTEEEIGDVFQAARNAKLGSANDNSRHRLSVVEIARAIEQALKERNT
jgi:hypothetical protein